MQPDNPIVGGIVLRIPAIRSPDYVPGVSGWTINVDGTAEFNNVTVRGTFIASGSNGSFVELHSVGNTAEIAVEPGGGNVNAATIKGGVTAGGQPQLLITSPQQTLTSPNSTASVIVQGANASLAESFIGLNADAVQIIGAAGNSGVGDAVLNLGNLQGSPAGVNLGIVGGSSLGIDGGGLSIANNITLSTGSVSFLITTMDDGTNRLYLLRTLDNFDCSSTLTLTTTSTLITGCQHTYTNIKAGSRWSVIGTFDCGLGGTANTDIGELWVNQNGAGLVHQTGDASFNGGLNTRAGVTRSWSGVFTAGGTIIFQLQGRQGGAGGTNVMATPGTTMQVAIYQ